MDLAALVNQFGFGFGTLMFVLWLASRLLNNYAARVNHVETTKADARSKTETSQADAFISVVRALDKTVEKMGESDARAQQERQQTLMRIERLTGHMEGMTTAILGSGKTVDALKVSVADFGDRLDEFGTRIQPLRKIETDLAELVTKATTIQAGFNLSLGEHIAPVLALLLKLGADIETVSTNAITIVNLIRLMAEDKAEKGEPHEDFVQAEPD